jgi:hypothetical protein
MSSDPQIKSEDPSIPQQTDPDKQILIKEFAGLLIFIAIVLIAYYVALNVRQT